MGVSVRRLNFLGDRNMKNKTQNLYAKAVKYVDLIDWETFHSDDFSQEEEFGELFSCIEGLSENMASSKEVFSQWQDLLNKISGFVPAFDILSALFVIEEMKMNGDLEANVWDIAHSALSKLDGNKLEICMPVFQAYYFLIMKTDVKNPVLATKFLKELAQKMEKVSLPLTFTWLLAAARDIDEQKPAFLQDTLDLLDTLSDKIIQEYNNLPEEGLDEEDDEAYNWGHVFMDTFMLSAHGRQGSAAQQKAKELLKKFEAIKHLSNQP